MSSLFQFSYFLCPECDFQTVSDFTIHSRQTFVDHVCSNHSWALKCLQNISDLSIENIVFPIKNELDPSSWIKKEKSDCELPECDTYAETHNFEYELEDSKFVEQTSEFEMPKKLKVITFQRILNIIFLVSQNHAL